MTDWAEILDGGKLRYHQERFDAWQRGIRIAPITIDMAITRACNYACGFCAAQYQENDRHEITLPTIERFLLDCADIGVKAISLVSDGESSIHPNFEYAITRGRGLGIDMAVGSNAFVIDRAMAERILPSITYMRVNFSGGTRERYAEIMGVKPSSYDRVVQNVRDMVEVKRAGKLACTVGLQMVLMPNMADQILPLAKLGRELGVDYVVIKHVSDTPEHTLGIDYSKFDELHELLREAESYSTDTYRCQVKWTKIKANGGRTYQRCYGPPFILQISGSGLVAPCGGLFSDRFRKFHIGNIVDQSFKEMVRSDRYWEVVRYLASEEFDAQETCDSLCLQHMTNTTIDNHVKGVAPIRFETKKLPYRNFI